MKWWERLGRKECQRNGFVEETYDVYLAYSPDIDMFKIGYSLEPEVRIRKLSVYAHLVLDTTISCCCRSHAIVMESYLHGKFHKNRITGEWFKFPWHEKELFDTFHRLSYMTRPCLMGMDLGKGNMLGLIKGYLDLD